MGLPLKGDSVDEFDDDVQNRLEMEFEMFGDILQVGLALYKLRVLMKKVISVDIPVKSLYGSHTMTVSVMLKLTSICLTRQS